MKALVTGASSGIGRDMAKYLGRMGCDLILVARDEKGLKKVAKDIKTETRIIATDLSDVDNCKKLYNKVKKDDIDILINNAGFGTFGQFTKTDLDKELNMIDLNIKAVHILTKLFLKDMKAKDHGYILNVASSAAFQPGPLMAAYYSTKAYILRLTTAIYEELRRESSNVVISVLCPGPVETNFNNVANVEFQLKSSPSNYVAKYGIDNMFKKKLIIIPSLYMKILYIFSRISSTKMILKISYNIQQRKGGKNK
ncbi:MAG: SDR family oxidoreductase [Bacilli bacterium]|nr:SDR family oxidoreductase [Bacilli bacterium]MDD3304814.1 SDR family oxidoreductase [Bacilli bacterium]MDD4053401.1 SDR family oxidoreductase [Bacilli bacterium]MDD4410952.1 SDR family oxidoreductase [Bacilli bacterium]